MIAGQKAHQHFHTDAIGLLKLRSDRGEIEERVREVFQHSQVNRHRQTGRSFGQFQTVIQKGVEVGTLRTGVTPEIEMRSNSI